MKRITVTLAVFVFFVMSGYGQGFQNLNFESANNLPGNPGTHGMSVPVTNALPDWTAYQGVVALASLYYLSNNFPGGVSSAVELEGGSLALGGDFSAGVYPGGSISQTAVVSDNAESLEFEAEGPGPGGSLGGSYFMVILGGQTLSYSVLSTGPDYIEYGANIPAALDGQMETLTFSSGGNVLLDNIQFSSTIAPEPSEYALLGLGGVLLGLRHFRKPLRQS